MTFNQQIVTPGSRKKVVVGVVFVFLLFIAIVFFYPASVLEAAASASTEDKTKDAKEIIIESLSDPDTEITMEENSIIVEDKEDSSDDESISIETDPNTIAADGDLTITSPIQNQVMNNDLLIIAGEAPSGSLVDVIITNEDNNENSFSKHKGFTLNGTVTSDKDGYWAFVPSSDLANGHYSVYATIELQDNDDLISSIVFFQIHQDDYSWLWLVIIPLVLAVFSYVAYKIYKYWDSNRRKIEHEAQKTQKADRKSDSLRKEGEFDEADLNKDGVVDKNDVEQAQSKLIIDALNSYTSKEKKNRKKKSKKNKRSKKSRKSSKSTKKKK